LTSLHCNLPTITLRYYGYHPYNNPTHSERNIELPMAFWFLNRFQHAPEEVVEIGEVTPFYASPKHAVFDPASELSGSIRSDALDVDCRGKHVLSVSTLEHIGRAEYGQEANPTLLPRVLKNILGAKSFFVTFALGYNRDLEELVPRERCLLFRRIAPTRWIQTNEADFSAFTYHQPWYAGNGLCVLTNIDELHFAFKRRSFIEVSRRFRAPKWSWKAFIRSARQEVIDDIGFSERHLA
jgi:hypothetical protein